MPSTRVFQALSKFQFEHNMQFIKHTLLLLGALLPAILGAPIHDTFRAPETIPGKYIVTFKQGIDAARIDDHSAWATDVHRHNKQRLGTTDGEQYMGIQENYKINRFAAYYGSFDDVTIEAIRNHDDVCAQSFRCT